MVPMILLPVISEPFQRIAMGIVGPLLMSQSGNKYTLVVCDYGTRYPEVVQHCIDAATIVEGFLRMFALCEFPSEFLTDHGCNFT